MNPEDIRDHLESVGHTACLSDDYSELRVEFFAGGARHTLLHRFPLELLGIPRFDLMVSGAHRNLAHVIRDSSTGRGAVCVGDADSLSVNIDVPPLAYEASVQRHVQLLTRLIEEPDWNRLELLREFHTNWERLCYRAGTIREFIYFANQTESVDAIEVKLPHGGSSIGIRGHHVGLTRELLSSNAFDAARWHLNWASRTTIGKGILVRVATLLPAPLSVDELWPWYVQLMSRLDDRSYRALEDFRRQSGKRYWLVFFADVPGGTTWFAIYLESQRKGRLPLSVAETEDWSLVPYGVRSLSRESLVPRGGGLLELSDKSVLLIGCGAVGTQLAHQLSSCGLGHLTVSDPDQFIEANLYRHTLSLMYLEVSKSLAVCNDLQSKHPWTDIVAWNTRLENLRDSDKLSRFDLIIIAIGSPTVERVFRNYCRKAQIDVPCINCWVEAYGIGGHAILDVPGSRGCWHCAYVCPRTLHRGLASNLNFLAPNQDLTMTYGGCGYQFLPFSGVAATYTATMTADLAVRFLDGSVTTSSKISWKGSATDALGRGYVLTCRYHRFKESLSVLPLYNDECDVCTK